MRISVNVKYYVARAGTSPPSQGIKGQRVAVILPLFYDCLRICVNWKLRAEAQSNVGAGHGVAGCGEKVQIRGRGLIIKTFAGGRSGQPNPALSSQFVIPAAKAPQEWRHQHHRTYFKLEHTQKSEVKTAMLNVFVKNMNGDDGKSKFTIYVNKYLDENTVSTEGQIVFAKHHVMNGDQWEQIEVTDIINEWINNPDTNYGMQVKVIPDGNGVAFFDPIDRHSNNSQYFLEVVQMPNLRKRRELQHDNGSQICTIDPSHPDSYCCRYHLEIDFKDFEWGFVIAPSKYTAYYCAGRCRPGQSAKTLHARFMEIKMPQHMCCAPDKLGDFKLFHKGPGSNTAVVTTIRNMVVQSCGCK
ncbi:unnamed protein product, partial [Mesorhabditis spiculigera]